MPITRTKLGAKCDVCGKTPESFISFRLTGFRGTRPTGVIAAITPSLNGLPPAVKLACLETECADVMSKRLLEIVIAKNKEK